MLTVLTDAVEVDGLLAGGWLRCPACTGRLGPWGHARPRSVREEHGPVRHHPRLSRCSGCGRTHVLLAASMLRRRADGEAVIGAALAAKVRQRGPLHDRGWERPAGEHGPRLAAPLRPPGRTAPETLFTGLLHALDPAVGSLLPTDSKPVCGVPNWCRDRQLAPLTAQRHDLELHLRWLQDVRRLKPSTVSRRLSIVAGFYGPCVTDGILMHRTHRPLLASDRAVRQWLAAAVLPISQAGTVPRDATVGISADRGVGQLRAPRPQAC